MSAAEEQVQVKPATAEQLGLGQAADLPTTQRVDYDNWTLPPFNRWSFQHVQQFTRTGRISRAPDPALLHENPQPLDGVNFTDSQGSSTSIAEMLERTWTDGFLVLHRGEVITEQYFNGMEADTLHLMMSCSKSMTSALMGTVIAEGLLDTQAPLSVYVPELAATGMAHATVQQALDMQVGLKFEEDYSDLDGEWRNLEIATGWRVPGPGYSGPTDLLAYMETLKDSAGPHGAVFHYQSILSDALGLCLERATGRSFLELFAKRIWHPMGAEHDLVTIVDAGGTAIFEGGFNCSLRDFARFGQLICDGGIARGEQLVPASWIDECRFAGTALVEVFSRGEYGAVMPGHAYHNQWWVRDPGKGVIMALGIHGQTIYIDPEREFVVAKYSSQPEHDNLDMTEDHALGFEAILKFLESQ